MPVAVLQYGIQPEYSNAIFGATTFFVVTFFVVATFFVEVLALLVCVAVAPYALCGAIENTTKAQTETVRILAMRRKCLEMSCICSKYIRRAGEECIYTSKPLGYSGFDVLVWELLLVGVISRVRDYLDSPEEQVFLA